MSNFESYAQNTMHHIFKKWGKNAKNVSKTCFDWMPVPEQTRLRQRPCLKS